MKLIGSTEYFVAYTQSGHLASMPARIILENRMLNNLTRHHPMYWQIWQVKPRWPVSMCLSPLLDTVREKQ